MSRQNLALMTRDPALWVNVVVVVASCFLTLVKVQSPIAPSLSEFMLGPSEYKLVNVIDLVEHLKTSMRASSALFDRLFQIGRGAAVSNPTLAAIGTFTPFGTLMVAADRLRMIAQASGLLYLCYLAPVGAIANLVQGTGARKSPLMSLATGIACLVTFGLLVAMKLSIISAFSKVANGYLAATTGRAIVLGAGSYVILICGIVLVGVNLWGLFASQSNTARSNVG